MANRYIKATYKMFTNSAASHKLLYETERPVEFVTGMGLMIDGFEERLAALQPSESFDFTLKPAEAFGERDETKIHTEPRKTFEERGKFDDENIYPGAEVPLMDAEGNYFYGTVVRVTPTSVVLDLNSPLAGKALQFTGTLFENREATLFEIEQTARLLSGEDCAGSCQGCQHECGSAAGKGCDA